jgi:hypothetical protein
MIFDKNMKKRKHFFGSKNLVINTSPEIKMSELIGEYASDYINMGDATEERQSLLNGACTAWNIAILPEHSREEAIRRVIKNYKRVNPGIDDAGDFEHDLRILIQKKLELFPEIRKTILGGTIEPISDAKYRINIASTDDRNLLKGMLGRGSGQR